MQKKIEMTFKGAFIWVHLDGTSIEWSHLDGTDLPGCPTVEFDGLKMDLTDWPDKTESRWTHMKYPKWTSWSAMQIAAKGHK